MLSDNVEGDGKGQDVAGHDENSVQHVSSEKQLPSYWAEKDRTGIGYAGYLRISVLELSYHIASIGSENTQSNQDDDGRGQPYACDSSWERQDAHGHGFGNHQKTTLPGKKQIAVSICTNAGRIAFAANKATIIRTTT